MTSSILSAERAMWLRLLNILAGHVQPLNGSADVFTGFSRTPNRLEFNLDEGEGFMGMAARSPSVGDVEIVTDLRCWKNPDFKVSAATFYLTTSNSSNVGRGVPRSCGARRVGPGGTFGRGSRAPASWFNSRLKIVDGAFVRVGGPRRRRH